jgi:hypothetical protein
LVAKLPALTEEEIKAMEDTNAGVDLSKINQLNRRS